jgi:hypothetical protein
MSQRASEEGVRQAMVSARDERRVTVFESGMQMTLDEAQSLARELRLSEAGLENVRIWTFRDQLYVGPFA